VHPQRAFVRFAVSRVGGALWRALKPTIRPLRSAEVEAAQSVLGADAIAWDHVRVCEGGVWALLTTPPPFRRRLFVLGYWIIIPDPARATLPVMVHETVHVLQYERGGWGYFIRSMVGQATQGVAAFYDYGGRASLRRTLARGGGLRSYNVEQQAMIAQHYYEAVCAGDDDAAYLPFIAQLRRGEVG